MLNLEHHNKLSSCLDLQPPMLISLVGAGGKTTAMLRLARELSADGHTVIVTTSTKIYRPSLPLVLQRDPSRLASEAEAQLKKAPVLALAGGLIPSQPQPKLAGLAPQVLDGLFSSRAADFIIVEADGSRRLPLKAPRAQEPVIPCSSSLVIGVLGLSALGAPADPSQVFGWREFQKITGKARGEPIDPYDLIALWEHDKGIFKGSPKGAAKAGLLNQLDALPPSQWPDLLEKLHPSPELALIAGSFIKKLFYCLA